MTYVVQLPHAAHLSLPTYATRGSAGVDLRAAVKAPVRVPVGDRRLIPTGLRVAIPTGHELQIRPRSGLALRHGVTVLNSPGTIDSDYRDEVMVLLMNHGDNPFTVEPGERIAQAVLAPIARINWELVDELPETGRSGGFGSTGTN